MAFVVLGAAAQSSPLGPDTALVQRVKIAIVRDMDDALPKITLEAWLRGLVGAKAAMAWEVNDCGETGRGDDPTPVCVQVNIDVAANRELSLFLVVGASDTGVTAGPPHLLFGVLSHRTPYARIADIYHLTQVQAVIGK
jgi:hypothetical protein